MTDYDLAGKRVWVAGHRGMVGSALVRRLAGQNCEVLTVPRAELDLTDKAAVHRWMHDNRPDAVFVAAAKVGGILANDSLPVDFLLNNLLISTAIISGAHESGVEKLLYLGSSCIYPKFAPQPIPEDALLTGKLEPTNEWYAVAKIAGIKLTQAYRKQYGRDYISAMPTNLYGPGDNYDPQSSHVMPALLRKVHAARASGGPVSVWGTGTPRREFLYVDDCADACIFLMRSYSGESHVNVGSGEASTWNSLAHAAFAALGRKANIQYIDMPEQLRGKYQYHTQADLTRIRNAGYAKPITPLADAVTDYIQNYLVTDKHLGD